MRKRSKLDFLRFLARFSQPFTLQSVAGSCNGVFKPIAETSNRLQDKILQNSHPKNVESQAKLCFTLIEVMIAISLLILATSAIGWKMHGMIEKKRFSSHVERLHSRLLTCRQLSLNMQADWKGILACQGKKWTFDAFCVDNPKTPQLPPLILESLEFTWNGEDRKILSFEFTASGDIFPQGSLQIQNGKMGAVEWKFPDLFSFREGNKLGPTHPDDLDSRELKK